MFAPGTSSRRRPKIPEKNPYDPRGCDHEQPDVECATSLPQSPRKQNDGRQCAPPPEPSPPRPHALVRCAPFHEPVRRMDPRASRDTQYHATQPRAAPKTHTWPLLTLGLRTTEVHDGPASYAREHTLPACKCARAALPPQLPRCSQGPPHVADCLGSPFGSGRRTKEDAPTRRRNG